MDEWIFRLCSPEEWSAFRERGDFPGNDGDRRDGFLHFSTVVQIAGTAARHYPPSGSLVLMAVEAAFLGDSLKWEESRGGALFPHLHGSLSWRAVRAWRTMSDRDFGFLREAAQPMEAQGWTCIP